MTSPGAEPPFTLSRETTIRIDREGRFWHEGEPVERPELTRALASWVGVDPETGRYKLENSVNWCFVTVEDAPLVVTSLAFDPGGRVELALTDGTVEPLDPETLRVDADDVPYCDVRGGSLPARFSRPAAFALLERGRLEGERLVLTLGEQEHPVKRVPRGEGASRSPAAARTS